MTAEQQRLEEMASNRAPREKAKAPRGEFEAFTKEDLALLYMRQARTALVTIAVLVVAWVVASVVTGVVVMIAIFHENELLRTLMAARGR
jgi:hypothetical protein